MQLQLCARVGLFWFSLLANLNGQIPKVESDFFLKEKGRVTVVQILIINNKAL
jgi:hypothetical protein